LRQQASTPANKNEPTKLFLFSANRDREYGKLLCQMAIRKLITWQWGITLFLMLRGGISKKMGKMKRPKAVQVLRKVNSGEWLCNGEADELKWPSIQINSTFSSGNTCHYQVKVFDEARVDRTHLRNLVIWSH